MEGDKTVVVRMSLVSITDKACFEIKRETLRNNSNILEDVRNNIASPSSFRVKVNERPQMMLMLED